MGFFLTIVSSVLLLDLLWWWLADRVARRTARPRLFRTGVALFVGLQLLSFGLLLFMGRFSALRAMPPAWVSLLFIWHLIVLPTTMGLWLLYGLGWSAAKLTRRLGQSLSPPPAEPAAAPTEPSRRQFLAAAVVAAPPVATLTATGVALTTMDNFRVRRLDVPLASLPPELDGLTIAHVSDSHVGEFTNGPTLKRIIEATNALRADLVLLTGDLLNRRLSDLAAALDMVKRFDPGLGLFMIQGNHDLFEGREEFNSRVLAAGVPLLVNETRTIPLRGRNVQILGLRWGSAQGGMGRSHERGDEAIRGSLQELLPSLRPDAFPILLAHHPHAFDFAAPAGIPLTLAGHTHGGQLMLSRHVGAGNLIDFRYMSGLYQKPGAALVVSNGVGNWFPLRIGAPAEIVHLTLRKTNT